MSNLPTSNLARLQGQSVGDVTRARRKVERTRRRGGRFADLGDVNDADLRWQLSRGRRFRKENLHSFRKDGKTVYELCNVDAIMARLVHEKLRKVLQVFLPDEYVGQLGRSPQRASNKLAKFVRDHQSWFVLRFDVERFYESTAPKVALQALVDLGAPDDVVATLRAFYATHGADMVGIGRGLAFAPLLGAAVLLATFRRISGFAQKLVWMGDDFCLLSNSREALVQAQAFAERELARVGLHFNPSKTYLGVASGEWSFLGLDFHTGRVDPTLGATTRLIAKVDNAMLSRHNQKAKRVMEGWSAQYGAVDLDSPRIAQADDELQKRYGAAIPRLSTLISNACVRAPMWCAQTRVGGVGGRQERRSGQAGSGSVRTALPTSHSALSTTPVFRYSSMVSSARTQATVAVTRKRRGLRHLPAAGKRRPEAKPNSAIPLVTPWLPGRLRRAFLFMRSWNFWARSLRYLLEFHVERQEISVREASRCVRRAVSRARRMATKRKRTGRRTRARWWALTRDGQMLSYSPGHCGTEPSAFAARQ